MNVDLRFIFVIFFSFSCSMKNETVNVFFQHFLEFLVIRLLFVDLLYLFIHLLFLLGVKVI